MLKRTLALAALILAASPFGAAQAAPVAYVRVCTLYGAMYYYLPGTETCVNANTGRTKTKTEYGVVDGVTQTEQDALDALEGAAISMALPGTVVDPGKHFGVSAHFGTFEGQNALGVGGAFRLNDNVTFDGGVGVGLSYHTVGGRAGFNISW
ncbi:MAG: porin [Devosia sp.]|nr:porin [Devosia sp.]